MYVYVCIYIICIYIYICIYVYMYYVDSEPGCKPGPFRCIPLASLIAGAHGDLGIPDSSVKLAEWPHRLPEVGGSAGKSMIQ